MKRLKPYVAFAGDYDTMEFGLLVFAETRNAAKTLYLDSGLDDASYLEVNALQLKETEYILSLRRSDTAHVIDDPPSCKDCFEWSTEPLADNGICIKCNDLRASSIRATTGTKPETEGV